MRTNAAKRQPPAPAIAENEARAAARLTIEKWAREHGGNASEIEERGTAFIWRGHSIDWRKAFGI